MPVSPPAVVCEGLSTGFAEDSVREVTLSIARASLTVIGGETGSGKTAFLRTLGGALPPRAGSVRVWGENPYKLPADMLSFWRRRVALCTDDIPWIEGASVRDNLLFAANIAGVSVDGEAVAALEHRLQRFGIDPEALPETLSRGRVAALRVLRTLVGRADVLLFDDPIAVCDPQMRTALYRLMFEAACGGACVIVSGTGPTDPGLGAAALLQLQEGRLIPAAESVPSRTRSAAHV